MAYDAGQLERSLHAAFRLRLARVASTIAWITIAALLLVIVLRHRDDTALRLGGLLGLLTAAALANLLTNAPAWRRMVEEAASGWPFYVWTALLLAFNSAMVLLARAEPAEMYLLYVPVALFAAAALALWAALSTVGLALLSYIVTLWLSQSDLETGELALRGVVFLVVGLLGAYLAAEQRREAAERARREAQAVEQSHDLRILHGQATGLASELQATVDALQDGMVTVDSSRRVTSLNPAAERLLGWPASAAMGQPCATLLDPLDSQGDCICASRCPARPSGDGNTPSLTETRVLIRRRDGQRIACALRSATRTGENGATSGHIYTIRDMTEEERWQEEMYRRNRDLRVLISTGEKASESLDPDVMLTDVLLTLLQVTQLKGAAVFLAGSSVDDLTLRIGRGDSAHLATEGTAIAARAIRSERPVSRCLRSDAGLGVDSADEDEVWAVGVPLRAKSRTVGALVLAFPPGLTPASDEVELLGAVGNQLGVALEHALLYEEVQRKERLRGELLAKVISAEEEERKRIARELHDEAIQSLSMVLLKLGAVEQESQAAPETREQIAEVRDLMVGAIGEVRKAVLGLRPSALDDLGLVPALRSYAMERLEQSGVDLRWDAAGLRRRLPQEMETALFRIVQEAVNNIVRHSGAETVTIELQEDDERVTADVEDDGVGFDVGRVTRRRSGELGLGLLGMRERASLFGGTLEVNSAPGRGTHLHIELPLRDGHTPA